MRKTTIKGHLKPYSIFQKRKTTISHAFASALAPCDTYDEHTLDTAIRMLGQDPDSELLCVYCKKPADTWDHLIGLVKEGQLRGFGHQLGNLVPCCQACNSEKGSKDWIEYLDANITDVEERSNLRERLFAYSSRYACLIDLESVKSEYPTEWAKYAELKQDIFQIMQEADNVASILREKIRAERQTIREDDAEDTEHRRHLPLL